MMSEAERHAAITSHRKRRGVLRASITKMRTHTRDLEARSEDPSTVDLALRLSQKLEKLDSEFKQRHFDLIDFIEDEDELEKEQEILDVHDDEVSYLAIALKQLTTTKADDGRKIIAARRLKHVREVLDSIKSDVDMLTEEADICLLCQHE